MIGWLYRIVILFLILTVIYIVLSLYYRWKRSRRLGDEFDAQGNETGRDSFIAEGMKRYDRSLKPKLLLGIYLVPVVIVGLIYWANHQ